MCSETTMNNTYKNSGVDINAADDLIEQIKSSAVGTHTQEVMEGIGGFAGLYKIPQGMKDPVLVSSTDGVGTKLKIADIMGIHDTIGIDLVAMCVNDVITCGAQPLFFLDYFATSKLQIDVAKKVINGIVEGCREAGCAFIGGETAEMPGMNIYPYELAGFAVGIVERKDIVDGSKVSNGDIIIGISSSGIHSNGYSLIRNLVDTDIRNYQIFISDIGEILGKTLLTPTVIYVQVVKKLMNNIDRSKILAMCHITGGGIPGNLPRVLPEGFGAKIKLQSWPRPNIFNWIINMGVPLTEMFNTFNMGIGFCVIVSPENVRPVMHLICESKQFPHIIGEVVKVPPNTSWEKRIIYDPDLNN